ncbi:MAG: ABC transporter ATP-binding protein [Planctomycetales bacterium]|nr:ABC transporter ATP-binding protein [Planctomycetales bacterium]
MNAPVESVISVQRVVKRYGAVAAVDDVTFEAPAGCVFALLGENGAGKSTLVKMLLGLLSSTSGRLETLGFDASKHGDAIRARVGYVSERPVLYEWMTPAEIGWFAAGFYPDGFETRYRERLAAFRTPLDRKISQLSKGMRAKVSLALAMAHEPQLLVLDEPTSGLDTLVRHEFLDSMVEWAAAGRTVFLSSHLIGEVERVADYVAIMRAGKLLLVDKLDVLKQQTIEATVTMEGTAGHVPSFGGELLAARRRGRQWQTLVRRYDDDALHAARHATGVTAIETRTPTLEEIFVALMQPRPTAPIESDRITAQG